MTNEALENAVREASGRWIAAFNAQDAAGCAACYEPDAVMNAAPLGTFQGREQIEAFWAQLHADGYRDVEYIEPTLEVIDDSTAIVRSKWRMNKAHGVITNERWVLQDDGTALLREDDFEVQG